MSQTLIVHLIRKPGIPFVQSRAAAPLLIATCLIIAVGIALPMGPWAVYFKLTPLPPLYFVLLPFIIGGYAALTHFMKGYYARHFRWQ